MEIFLTVTFAKKGKIKSIFLKNQLYKHNEKTIKYLLHTQPAFTCSKLKIETPV